MSVTGREVRLGLVPLLLVLLAVPAWGAFSGTDVFLPMVGRGVGVGSAQWYTKVWAYNPNATSATVTFYLLERDKANAMTGGVAVTIPAGDTLVWDNAVGTLFGKSVWGAIRVTSDQKVVVNERFYAKPPGTTDKSTVGQDYAGIPRSFAIGAGERTDILGTYQTVPSGSSEQRYNFGFAETEGALCRVRVTPMDTTGAALASPKEYDVLAYSQKQIAFATAFPSVSTTNARLSVEVISGTGKVISYGTGIANTSQDPTTFEMQFKDALLSGGSGGLTAVSHDSSLTGDGTSGSPLGVADGGVTPAKLSVTGSSSGQVLTSSGSAASWQDATGLTLPFSASQAGNGVSLFDVTNTGTSSQWGSPIAISAAATGSSGMALDATASGSANLAVRGRATTTGAVTNYGGYFEAYGDSGRAVAGAVNGSSGRGVFGTAVGSGGYGLFGEVADTTGIGAMGRNLASGNYTDIGTGSYGLHAVAFSSGGYGVYAQSADGRAVQAESSSHVAVWGESSTQTGVAGLSASGNGVTGDSTSGDGVAGWTTDTNKSGVYGHSNNGLGVTGISTNNSGVQAVTYSSDANTGALWARNLGAGPGIYAVAGSGGYAAVLSGRTSTEVLEITGGSDLSEQFDVGGPEGDRPAPGMVVSIDPAREGALVVARRAYDRTVAGVISGAGGIKPGMLMSQAGSAASGDRPVALTGRVYCLADAAYGAIAPGDLVTTSNTPGHAMKVADHARAQGATLGKAMSALPSGRGLILVLVSLQ